MTTRRVTRREVVVPALEGLPETTWILEIGDDYVTARRKGARKGNTHRVTTRTILGIILRHTA